MSRKILVVIPKQGGARALGENIVYALNRMDHTALTFDCGQYSDNLGKMVRGDETLLIDLFNQSLVVKALQEKADVVLVMALSPITPFTVQVLKNGGIKTVHYFCEDLKASEQWKPVIGAYDLFLVIQKDPWLKELKSDNNANTQYLPHGAPLECQASDVAGKEFDVTFMGAPYNNRIKFFERLCHYEIDFRIWGGGWDKFNLPPPLKDRIVEGSKWMNHEEIYSIYRRSKIVINLHATLTGQEIDETGDFINPRTFTIPLCHALQLTDRRKALADFYEEDREIVCFGSVGELADKIEFYLDHWEKAEAIIQAAHEKTLSYHMLSHRLAEMLEMAGGKSEAPADDLNKYVALVKDKMKNNVKLGDEDFIYLLAEDLLVNRSTGEAGHG
jgi:spore maturation protein CgeB